VAPCFPKEFEIVRLFERKYKENVENMVFPFLEKKKDLLEDPGFLIILVSWLDRYEDVLGKIGVKENDYVNLRSKAKQFLPELMDHLERFMNESMMNIIKEDRSLYSKEEIEKMKDEGQEISSNFSQDIFSLINRQLEIVGTKTRGEVYMEIIRLWTVNLAEFQKQEKSFLIKTSGPNEILKIIMYINNYYKCLQNITFTKDESLKYADEEYHDRLDNIFSDLKRAFAESIQDLLVTLVDLCFIEVELGAIVYLFRKNWIEEDVVGIALDIMKELLTGLKQWLISPLHYSRTVRLSLERLGELYFERFLYTVKKSFSVLKAFEPTKRKVELQGEMKDEERSSRPGSKVLFENTSLLLGFMERDLKTIIEFTKTNYENNINVSYLQKIKADFEVIFDLFKTKQFDFDSKLHKVYDSFKESGIFVLKAVVSVRQDCDEKFKKEITKIYESYYSK